MMPKEFALAAPALAMIWPCIALAVLFGCVWGMTGPGLPAVARLPIRL